MPKYNGACKPRSQGKQKPRCSVSNKNLLLNLLLSNFLLVYLFKLSNFQQSKKPPALPSTTGSLCPIPPLLACGVRAVRPNSPSWKVESHFVYFKADWKQYRYEWPLVRWQESAKQTSSKA